MVANIVSQFLITLDKSLSDIFSKEENYLFLCGAGISMNHPSNLPSAGEILTTILEVFIPLEYYKFIEKTQIRFEIIIDFLQRTIDPKLKCLDYFDLNLNPNLIHYFLAIAILNLHPVLTTNFDYLIEIALQNIIRNNSDFQSFQIQPIITTKHYRKFNSIEKMFKQKKLPVMKIHGSKKNFITEENCGESLIATISRLEEESHDSDLFSVSGIKEKKISECLKDRVLVVLGYSGSDVFDIGPTLKRMLDLKQIIWIEHDGLAKDTDFKLYKILKSDYPESWELETSSIKLLAEIKCQNNYDIIFIKANTLGFIKHHLLDIFNHPSMTIKKSKISTEAQLSFGEYIHSNIDINELTKYQFTSLLLHFIRKDEELKKCLKEAIDLSIKYGKKDYEILFNKMLSVALANLGEYESAFKLIRRLIDSELEAGNIEVAIQLNLTAGKIFNTLDKPDFALKLFEDSSKTASSHLLELDESVLFKYRGISYLKLNQFQKSIKFLEKALKNTKMYEGRLEIMIHLSEAFRKIGNEEGAIDVCKKSLIIAEKLNDNYKKILALCVLAECYLGDKDKSSYFSPIEAVKCLEEAFELCTINNYQKEKINILRSMGIAHYNKGNMDLTEQCIINALKLSQDLGLTFWTNQLQQELQNFKDIRDKEREEGGINTDLGAYGMLEIMNKLLYE